MAGLDDAGVGAFFTTPGCTLGDFSAGDILTSCAGVGIDTNVAFCSQACYGGSASFFGNVSEDVCCQCAGDADPVTTCSDSGAV